MAEGWGVRIPASGEEIVDEMLAGDVLAQAVEDGWVKCHIHLGTGAVVYRLATSIAAAA
ncbi:hypothetical protein AB0A69_07655 [Streptomyces sp. NPDC045431]|uniref:hypothetical protein n=1 Tax=Streptomyces sp. NPDC045431 TaxID=3155613 RepID=UPI00340BA56A